MADPSGSQQRGRGARISGCILAKNEGPRIADALRSLAAVTDELVVVDNGSTDSTREVAGSFGARVIELPAANHDGARNAYLDAASGDWVVVLDADERLDSSHAMAIRDALDGAPDQLGGLKLPCFNYHGDGGWCCTWILRVWRRHPAIRYERRLIHSSVFPSLARAGYRLDASYAPIHHIDALTPGRTEAKRRRNVRRIAEDLPIEPGLQVFLALEYEALGEHERALAELREAVAPKSPPWSPYWTAMAHLFLARFMLRGGGSPEEARAWLRAMYSVRASLPDPEHACLAWAESHVAEQNYAAALDRVNEALSAMPQSPHMLLNKAALSSLHGGVSDTDALDRALELNPLTLHPILYRSCSSRNIYAPQSSLLSCTPNLYRQLADSAAPDTDAYKHWDGALADALRHCDEPEPDRW
jgi:tetratricopeptide (TPR) repeat protein